MTRRPERVVVAGASGGFGRAFTGVLTGAGAEVVGVDRTDHHDHDHEHDHEHDHRTEHAAAAVHRLVADAVAPTATLLAELARADTLLLCLPERSLFDALPRLLRPLPPGALVVDVTSVKTRYAAAALALRDDVELCSLEPLFAPEVGFTGQQVLAAELRGGPRTEAFLALVGQTGAVLTRLDADAIDRQAAATQVAAHAALLAYGQALARLGFDPGGPTTALQRPVLALLARLTSRDPEVYWHIQRDNPYASEARQALRDAVDALDQLVTADDATGFATLLDAVGAALGPDRGAQAARSAAVVAAAASDPPDR